MTSLAAPECLHIHKLTEGEPVRISWGKAAGAERTILQRNGDNPEFTGSPFICGTNRRTQENERGATTNGIICHKTEYGKGANPMQTKADITACDSDNKPLRLTKRIGVTTYKVSVHFSRTSKETIEDKIIKLIESEVTKTA